MKTSNTNNATRQACEWVAKLHEAELTESEHDELKAWVAQSKENEAEIRRIAQQWDELNSLTMLAVPTNQSKPTEKSRGGYFSLAKTGLGFATFIAFGVLMVGLLGLWPQSEPQPVQKVVKEVLPYSTEIGEQRLIILPDASTVLLNTNSQFSVAFTSQFRDIYLLQGEAHFEVQPDSKRPFRVFAGKSQVRAVGTAFSVYLKKTTVDITVTHGSVKVDSIKEPLGGSLDSVVVGDSDTGAIVSAGHAAKFDQLEGSVETEELSEASVIPAWHHGKLKFSGEPLSQFVEEVSRYSPLSIVILDSELRDLRVGGLFDVGETNKMFEALESGFGIKVDYINERLVHLTAAKPEKAKL